MFCEKCGRMLDDDDSVCPLCQTAVKKAEKEETVEVDIKKTKPVEEPTVYAPVNDTVIEDIKKSDKSRLAAGFLQIFLGGLGVGRFYLGYHGIGVMQLAASFFTCGVAGFLWGFVDGVRILCGYPEKDSMGNELDY